MGVDADDESVPEAEDDVSAAGLDIAAGEESPAGAASAAKAGAERAVANRAAVRKDRVRFITGISLSWAAFNGRGVIEQYCDTRAMLNRTTSSELYAVFNNELRYR